jgi:DNA-binding IclR family transcriptional regulator
VASVHKAFALLAAFSVDDSKVLSLGELAARTGLPKPTAHRLAKSLVDVNVLERVDGGYQLGMTLFELGGLVWRRRDLREAALPFMEDLYEATHQMVHLAVLDNTEVVYLEKIQGHGQLRVPSAVGRRMPAYCTGVGKALLAHAGTVSLNTKELVRRTPYTITAKGLLARELAKIRSTGVAIDREESALGISCVAAPVMVDDSAVAAISVTGPPSRIDVDTLVPAVRTAALALGRELRRQASRSRRL